MAAMPHAPERVVQPDDTVRDRLRPGIAVRIAAHFEGHEGCRIEQGEARADLVEEGPDITLRLGKPGNPPETIEHNDRGPVGAHDLHDPTGRGTAAILQAGLDTKKADPGAHQGLVQK